MAKKGIHYLQIVNEGSVTNLRKKCMQSVKDAMGPEDTYEAISIPRRDNIVDMVRESEVIRFTKAAEIPNMCYIDTDCFIHKPLKNIKEGKPYFASYDFGDSKEKSADIYYFFVNEQTEYFKNRLNPAQLQRGVYSFPPEVLQALDGYVLIPDNSYLHLYDTLQRIVAGNQEVPVRQLLDDHVHLVSKLRRNIEVLGLELLDFDKNHQKR